MSNRLSHVSHPGASSHPNLEVFLSQIEHELFRIPDESLTYFNLTKEEWQAIRTLADDRSIVIKKANERSCVVVWDRDDYLSEAEKRLCNKRVHKDFSFNKKILSDLVTSSNKIFKSLQRKGAIPEKEIKYFLYDCKNGTNIRKLNFLPKIHKELFDLLGRPIISNCGTPTEKASEFLDHRFKTIMQSSWSYIKDSGDFLKKIKQIKNLPENFILVNADVVGLYPSIPLELDLKALEEAQEKRESKQISTDNLINLAKFVLQNNYFEFNRDVKH